MKRSTNIRNMSMNLVHGVLCCLFIMFSCTKVPMNADNGSGTGVGNGVVMGCVLNPNNTPVKNGVVRLRSQIQLELSHK